MDHARNFGRVAEKIVDRLSAKKIDTYELFYTASKRLSIESEGKETEDFKFSEPYGVALRVIVDGGMGFSFSTLPDDPAIETMVESAVGSARNSTPDEHYALAGPVGSLPETGVIFDDAIEKAPLADKITRARLVEEGALAADPRVVRVRGARYAESSYEVFLRNSLGVDISYKKSVVSAQVMAMAEQDGEQEMAYDADFSIGYEGLDPYLVGKRAGLTAVERLGAQKAPTGKYTALLINEVVGELLGVLSSSFLAENVLKGKSALAGREHEKIFSEKITVIDDGIMPGGVASSPVDDEGIVRGRHKLVDRGVLKGFLYDLLSARRAQVRPTGSSARDGVMTPPMPSPSNLFIVGGRKSPDSLVAEAVRGVIITELMGVHTANPVTGEFSVGASGFVFENGERLFPFKEGAVAGNLISMLSRAVAVGSDLRFFGGVGAPSLLVEGVDLSGQ